VVCRHDVPRRALNDNVERQSRSGLLARLPAYRALNSLVTRWLQGVARRWASDRPRDDCSCQDRRAGAPAWVAIKMLTFVHENTLNELQTAGPHGGFHAAPACAYTLRPAQETQKGPARANQRLVFTDHTIGHLGDAGPSRGKEAQHLGPCTQPGPGNSETRCPAVSGTPVRKVRNTQEGTVPRLHHTLHNLGAPVRRPSRGSSHS
jgi:hypothetical protein